MDLLREGQKALTRLHTSIYRLSGGRFGSRIGRVRLVLLTTTGRRSGRTRTTPLLGVPDGDRMILVASNGGAPRHPDWYLNLTADPEVVVQNGGTRRRMRARTADADERAALWPRAVAAWPGYDGYQRRAPREIPMVICEPGDHAAPPADEGAAAPDR